MWKTSEGSTGRLIQLCIGYFLFYVVTGITVKYFLGSAAKGFPGMNGMTFLPYSTWGGVSIVLAVVLALRWFRLKSIRPIRWGGFEFPSEYLYIIPSGVCTAVVIPTTTLMYTLPISVMVAMVIMRASVIVIGRVVDAIQIRRGILKKTVYLEENVAVVFAVIAASMKVFGKSAGGFDFLQSKAALIIFSCYISAYAVRIYIMNYYKNTRPKGESLNNKAFFTIEQFAATITLALVTLLIFTSPALFDWGKAPQVQLFNSAFTDPHPMWLSASFAGMAFGIVAFFSVFIFMFKGRTATFTGLVNRLTSLIAGTTATLVMWAFFGSRFPSKSDWIALFFIFVAVGFLTIAERRRTKELLAAREIEADPA